VHLRTLTLVTARFWVQEVGHNRKLTHARCAASAQTTPIPWIGHTLVQLGEFPWVHSSAHREYWPVPIANDVQSFAANALEALLTLAEPVGPIFVPLSFRCFDIRVADRLKRQVIQTVA
jgi:hypothetical protein